MTGDAAGTPPVRYRVFAPRGVDGGKEVSVFADAAGDLQARAAQADTPLSVFVESAGLEGVRLRTFTPQREKGESDSASVAALSWLQSQGQLADFAEVQAGRAARPRNCAAASGCSRRAHRRFHRVRWNWMTLPGGWACLSLRPIWRVPDAPTWSRRCRTSRP